MISTANIYTENRRILATKIRDTFYNINLKDIKASSIENIKKIFSVQPESKNIGLNRNPFMQAIMHLTLLDDERKGIKSHFAKVDDHWVLYRDDKTKGMSTYHLKNDHYENWAIMGLNFLDAALNLLGNKEKQALKNIAKKFLNRIHKTPYAEIELATMLHQKLYPFVANKLNISLSEAGKRLADARDFSNFKLPNTCVATRTQTEKGPVIEIDIPISGLGSLSQQLKNNLKRINALDGKQINEITNIAWFDRLDLHVKKLIKKYATEILVGKTIPTQLRKYLPGIRNTGESFLYDKYDKLIDNSYHAAMPATELKSNNVEATTQGLLGLKKSIAAEHIIICALTTPLPGLLGGDRNVTNTLKAALALLPEDKKSRFHYANLPVHGYRRIPGIETYDGIDKILQIALTITNDKNNKMHEKFDALNKEIKHYQQLRSSINPIDFENNNMKIVASAERMSFLINEITEKRKIAFIMACKSGKDRTGFARFYCTCYAYSRHFMKKIENVFKYFSHSNQPGKQAGWVGSTLGSCFFLESMKNFGIPHSINQDKNISDLTGSTAKANKGKFPNPSIPWYKQQKFWYAFTGFLLGCALAVTGFGAIFGAPLIASSIIGTFPSVIMTLTTIIATLFMVKKTINTFQYLKKFIKDHHRYEKNTEVLKQMTSVETSHDSYRSLITTGVPMSLARLYASTSLDSSPIFSCPISEAKSPEPETKISWNQSEIVSGLDEYHLRPLTGPHNKNS